MGQIRCCYVAGGSVTLPYGVVCSLRGRGKRRGQAPALRFGGSWGDLGIGTAGGNEKLPALGGPAIVGWGM